MVLVQFVCDAFVAAISGKDGFGFWQRQPPCGFVRLDCISVILHLAVDDGEHTRRLVCLAQLLEGGLDLLVDLAPHAILLGVHQITGGDLFGLGDTAHDAQAKDANLAVQRKPHDLIGPVADRSRNLR